MNQACLLFVKQHTTTIIEKNLCRNILLHLVSMHDFGLVNTVTIDKAMALLKQQKDGQGQSKMQDDADGGSSCDGEASVSSLVNTQNHWNLILTVCVELSVSGHQTPPGFESHHILPTHRVKADVEFETGCGLTAPYSADHDFGLMSSEFKAIFIRFKLLEDAIILYDGLYKQVRFCPSHPTL